MAEFRFLGYLAEIYGKKRVVISLERPGKLRGILGTEFPEGRSIVLINGRVGNFNSVIRDGDKVVIMPVISGG
jgi:molybdopterin converting factor small subunit